MNKKIIKRAVGWLGGLKELEGGDYFVITTTKNVYSLRSIGYHHIILYDYETEKEINDFGYLNDDDELITALSDYFDESIKEISMY